MSPASLTPEPRPAPRGSSLGSPRGTPRAGQGKGFLARISTLLFLIGALPLIPLSWGADGVEDTAPGVSRIVAFTGQLESASPGSVTWTPARVGQSLPVGTRLRTGPQSRATLQFSDRSVLRLGPSSLLEIQPPRAAPASKRFRLDFGRLFFFDRERPSDIEFETPLANGAIRGTEFALAGDPDGDTLSLAVLDGQVELQSETEIVALKSGEETRLARGQPARVTRGILAVNLVQWCLYYPGILHPPDLQLTPPETTALALSLEAWRRGAVIEAFQLFPPALAPATPATLVYRATVDLALGDVDGAESALDLLPAPHPLEPALREVIAAVRFEAQPNSSTPTTASAWLARSYSLQSRSRLTEALAAARRAVDLAPDFGFAWIRLAELEHSHEHRRAASEALDRGLRLSPDSAAGHALRGFVDLARNQPSAALAAFDRAVSLDGELGNAWLGRALAFGSLGQAEAARRALQIAAALEPRRAELRSYLGKAWAEAGDATRAQKELTLAATLDPGDPTPWLYSALERHQNRDLNAAVRDLERSLDLNDRRSVFRSRLLLDQDRSIRSADLAALYDAVGLPEPAQRLAARAVQADYANFSGHLFLARALQAREDPLRIDLRLETPRQSELLTANLLAPPGAGNLSQQLTQQDHLRYFALRPVGLSSLTEYRSGGDWSQAASLFGSVDGLSYALDFQYLSLTGDHPNGDLERHQASLQVKQRVTPDDELYLQVGTLKSRFGDVATRFDLADPDLRVAETQEPHLYGGWHHAWSPGQHTLLLAAWLRDNLELRDLNHPLLFLRQTAGQITAVDTERARFDLDQASAFDLRSIELQHLWETPQFGLVAGGRFQSGDLDSRATLAGPLPPPFAVQQVASSLERFDGYGDLFWRPADSLRLSAGIGYHHLRYPENADLPPLGEDETSRDLVAPRAGLTWEVFPRTYVRAAYSQSLGGLYFDDSIRLEPTQTAGFTTAFRSLLPESVVGLVPGTRFETAGLGIDHTTTNGFYAGIEFQWRRSDGERRVGAASNSLPLPLPDLPTNTLQRLDFEERSFAAYATQLLGRDWSVALRYRLTAADLVTRFPEVPATALGREAIEQEASSLLHSLRLSLFFNHPSGWFAEWHTEWNHQENDGDSLAPLSVDLWQHHVFAGYRFARRRAEVRLGILNLTDSDDRLNPLAPHDPLPRERTFTASVRLNF